MNTVKPNTYDEDHPEQDPAEGSREVVNNDLAQTGKQEDDTTGKDDADKSGAGGKAS